MKSIKEYFRRGKTVKDHHHHHHHSSSHDTPGNPGNSTLSSAGSGAGPTPLPRTASASANLNVLAGGVAKSTSGTQQQQQVVREGAGKSARGKGGGSRERLVDGAATVADGHRRTVQQRPVSGESLVEIEQMQRQLQEMAADKCSLVLQLEERLEQVADLQNEIKILKIYQEQSVHQLEQKSDENAYLRTKLRDVIHSPLSDSEKQQLLLIDSHRHHSSAPASIALNVANDTGDATACNTPDWDKHSSSNVSDVSVACLQDKINQMQETHYSTNEELQATLQELTDLQRQLTELQVHNNRLGDEKNLMFDSLCRQTDRLKETRSELDSLKQLLSTAHDNSDTDNAQKYVEKEAQLLDIVQRLEVEKDNFRDRQQEIIQELQQCRISNDQGEEERSRLIERLRMLEGAIDAKVAENRQTEQELSQVRDECSGSKIEIDRLKDILDSARAKIVELEQDRDVSDKSELEELLDSARKEKDTLELEITHLREQVARSRNEIEKLREQVSILQEECKVTRNNAKCTQSELDYKVETLMSDKGILIEQLQRLQEAVDDLEDQNLCLNEDKRQLNGVLSETQRNLSEAEVKLNGVAEELGEIKKLRENENEEWEKFQNDLLTSVRVANDFKTEAQQDLQKIVLENKGFREKVRQLEKQIEKLKGSESSLVRSSIRRSIHVTPRKLDEGVILPPQPSEVENPPLKNIKIKPQDSQQMAENQNGPQLSKSIETKNSDLKVHKNSKLIALEHKKLPKIQDGDVIASAILNKSWAENEYVPQLSKSIKTQPLELKVPKNSNLIALERKKAPKTQDGDVIPAAILSRSLQEVNTTISELKNKSAKSSKNISQHERSLSNLEASKIQDVVDLPRKRSVDVDIADTTVYTGILGKPLTQKNVKANKTRQKTAKSLEKLLTEADEQKFRILGDMLAHIDQSIPVHLLNEEDRSLLKLKAFYDSREMYRLKPIAKKPKDELCISNPLLNSVFANPALRKIAEDPKLPTVEAISPNLELKESFSFARKQSRRYKLESATMLEDGLPERHLNASHKTYSTFKPSMNKSQSVSNLFDRSYLSDSDDEAGFKRYLTEEDLSRNFVIAPSDSKLSLNLWTGTYNFSKQPRHRTNSASSSNSDLHEYTVNEEVNRSSSFVFESPQESLNRKRKESHEKPVGEVDKSSGNTLDVSRNKKDASGNSLEPSGRFRRFVGGLFGSKENLGVIHEARNTMFAPKPDVIAVEAEVHRARNTLERPTSSIVFYEVQKDVQNNEFDRRKSLDESRTKFDDVIYENLPTSHREYNKRQLSQNLDDLSVSESKFETQEKNIYFDHEDTTDSSPSKEFTEPCSNSASSSVNSDKLFVLDINIPGERDSNTPVIRKTTDSMHKQRKLAESLCRNNFTEAEIELVQKVVQTTDDSQSRPQSDINNDDIIVIEWIDYCNQCKDVGTVPLSLEEYSREIKSGRSISELDKLTRRSTELNEQESRPKKIEFQQILATKENKTKFLNADSSANFLDQENLVLLENFARASSKKRALIKLDTLERKYNLTDDLDSLDNNKQITRSTSEIEASDRASKEFHYVEDLLDSWKSKTRRKMRNSIEIGGFNLQGPASDFRSLDHTEPIYQNFAKSHDSLPTHGAFKPAIKRPKALPRTNQMDDLLSDNTLASGLVKMTDNKPTDANDSDDDDEKSLSKREAKYADTLFKLPTLKNPNPSPPEVPSQDKDNNKTTANKLGSDHYPTLERVAVSHVLNNNLPVFGKLNDRIAKDSSKSNTEASKSDPMPKFEIRCLGKDTLNSPDNKDSFVRARNRFLQGGVEDKISSRSSSPRSSFHKPKPAND